MKEQNKIKMNAYNTFPLGMYDHAQKRWYRGFEVKGLDSDVISGAGDDPNSYRVFGKLVASGITRIFDIETGEDFVGWEKVSSRLFFADTLTALTEIVIATKGSPFCPTVYKCPMCSKFTKFENALGTEAGANAEKGFSLNISDDDLSSLAMENVHDLKFNTRHDLTTPAIQIHFDAGVEYNGTFYTEYEFRIPEIGDYITKAGGRTDKAGEKIVLYNCITAVNGIKGNALIDLKAEMGMKLMSLSLTEYLKLLNVFNSIGYDYVHHKVTCAFCGYQHEAMFDVTNFFASILKQPAI